MNINPISFGKAIKINTSTEVAEKILLNRNETKEPVQSSFLNVAIGEDANKDHVVYQLKDDESYIFTGTDAFVARGILEDTKQNPFFFNMFLDCAYKKADGQGELTLLKYKETDDNVTLKKAKYQDSEGVEISFSTIG